MHACSVGPSVKVDLLKLQTGHDWITRILNDAEPDLVVTTLVTTLRQSAPPFSINNR
jgi:hypothetical protein